MKTLTLEERFELLKNNKPDNYNKDKFGLSWQDNIQINLIDELYSFTFNHPYYGGDVNKTDDQARHNILTELNVPIEL